jgi:glyoxylase-like metal-dependent hydrolase (beta-lactamase superfamily II)/rhodanese-related sulfurtransferase
MALLGTGDDVSPNSIRQFYLSCLSQASYLITDHASGQAIVVDPLRDIEQYTTAAAESEATIVGVINTHFHADFVSGNHELAEETGAWIAMGSRATANYEFRRLDDNQVLHLGDTTVRIWHTPGHTPESVCVLVGTGREIDAVLTGDTLFIGDVGRPDLVAADGSGMAAEQMASELHMSLQRLLTLPDSVTVLPAHGAGSSCGKNLSADTVSTVGRERDTNPMLAPMPVDKFVGLVMRDQPAIPAYFLVDAQLNRQPRQGIIDRGFPRLSAREIAATTAATVIVDVRGTELYATGHVPGSVNIGLDGRLAETAGMVIDFDRHVIIAAADARAARQAHTRLRRVGLDNVDGYILVPDTGLELVNCDRIQPTELDRHAADSLLLDVRSPDETNTDGTVPGAINVPLAQLRAWLAVQENRDRLHEHGAIVYCAGGWRSSVAASLLRAETGAPVRDVVGGYSAISMATA